MKRERRGGETRESPEIGGLSRPREGRVAEAGLEKQQAASVQLINVRHAQRAPRLHSLLTAGAQQRRQQKSKSGGGQQDAAHVVGHVVSLSWPRPCRRPDLSDGLWEEE